MKEIGTVYGSYEQAKPIVVNIDTVYIHSDIEKIEEGNLKGLYKYNELQYNKDEYIQLMANKQEIFKDLFNLLAVQFSKSKNLNNEHSEFLSLLNKLNNLR